VQAYPPYTRRERPTRQIESLLLITSGLLWGAIALTMWQERRAEARRRLHEVSNRLLRQVFPQGMPR
jgi:hypothetical protein